MNTITKKSMLTLTSASLLVMLVVFSIGFWLANGELERQLQSQMDDSSRALAVVMQEPIYSYDKDLIADVLSSFVSFPYIYRIKAFDHRGRELGEKTASGDAPTDSQLASRTLDIHWLQGEAIGHLEVAYRRDSNDTMLDRLLVGCIIIGLVLLAALQLTNWATLSRLVVRPVRQVTRALGEIAAGGGDLTSRLKLHSNDEIGILANNFNRFIEQLHRLISEVMTTAEQVVASAETMHGTADKTAIATRTQLSETEQAATALNEMSATTHEVAQNAAQTATNTKHTQELAHQGCVVVERTVSQIHRLGEDLTTTADRVSQLRDNSDTIGSVLDVIKSIAEQTNLLALNAAIEAARAGEQGRGFAVVADEVRSLAQRTQESTREIERIIAELQTAANGAYAAMTQSRAMLEETIIDSNQAGQALEQIMENITGINDMNTQIATAAEEQNSVAEDVSRNVTNIFGITEEVSQNAGDVQSLSDQVRTLSDGLRRGLSQFRI